LWIGRVERTIFNGTGYARRDWRRGTRRKDAWLEDSANTLLDVLKEMVNQPLDVLFAVWLGESTEADSEQPNMQVGESEPGLESWRKSASLLRD